MPQRFDVVVLGAGAAGETAATVLARAGKRVALVEAELIGGECTNWACVPTKTLLRPPELRGQSRRTAGVGEPELDFARLAEYRDWMVGNHDDSRRVAGYESRGVTVVKERGRLAGHGRVETETGSLEADAVVIATGSGAAIPPLEGLEETGYWTSREVTALNELPRSVVFLGGGVVSSELAQFLARFGTRVTIVQSGDRLVDREERRIGELLGEILEEEGVELRLRSRGVRMRRDGAERVVELDSGGEARGDVVVVATGRRPRTDGIGLDTVGIEAGPTGIAVDERCRAAEGVWAVGDVTGVALFTHVGKYQARVAATDILGRPARADYRAVPRVVFTDPEVAAVGLSEEAARAQGIETASVELDLPSSIARPYTYEAEPRGAFGLVVDVERRLLAGAWAVAPLASEWIHQAVLAIRAEVPVDVLADTMAQFPSFTEAFGTALRTLD